jgi:hypothetical protein
MHPDFSVAKIEKKVRKLREQIRYVVPGKSSTMDVAVNLNYSSLNV